MIFIILYNGFYFGLFFFYLFYYITLISKNQVKISKNTPSNAWVYTCNQLALFCSHQDKLGPVTQLIKKPPGATGQADITAVSWPPWRVPVLSAAASSSGRYAGLSPDTHHHP